MSETKNEQTSMLKKKHTFRAFDIDINLYDGNPLDELKLDLVIVNNENNEQTNSKVIEPSRTDYYMMI